MKYPQILTEVHITERFLPRGVKKSSRAMYLEMVGAACSYLIDLDIQKYYDNTGNMREAELNNTFNDENSFLFEQGSLTNTTAFPISPMTQDIPIG